MHGRTSLLGGIITQTNRVLKVYSKHNDYALCNNLSSETQLFWRSIFFYPLTRAWSKTNSKLMFFTRDASIGIKIPEIVKHPGTKSTGISAKMGFVKRLSFQSSFRLTKAAHFFFFSRGSKINVKWEVTIPSGNIHCTIDNKWQKMSA